MYEANLRQLVQFIFVDNVRDSLVQLNLPNGENGIRDNHDLFVFFMDLLCKGLVMLYGGEDNKVPLESVTHEQLVYVTRKLKNAGIALSVDIKHVETHDGTKLTLPPCILKGETGELSDYKMRLVSSNVEYTIKFAIERLPA